MEELALFQEDNIADGDPETATFEPICKTEHDKSLGPKTTDKDEAEQIASDHRDLTGHTVDVRVRQ